MTTGPGVALAGGQEDEIRGRVDRPTTPITVTEHQRRALHGLTCRWPGALTLLANPATGDLIVRRVDDDRLWGIDTYGKTTRLTAP